MAKCRMNENISSEASPITNGNKSKTDIESGTLILTQEEGDLQIGKYIALLTRQLEDVTRLSQGMSTAHLPNFSPREGTRKLY